MNVLGNSSKTNEKHLQINFQIFHLPFQTYLIAVQNPQSDSYLFCNHRYQSILPSKFSVLLPRIPDPHLSLFQRCLPHQLEASAHSFHHTPTSQLRLPRQKSRIPGTQKQAPARNFSTQHLKVSNKQDSFKGQRKPVPNW